MEDFFCYEDIAGSADALGIMEINGQTIRFEATAYGASWGVRIDGKELPHILAYEEGCKYEAAWPKQHAEAGLKLVERLEQVARMTAEYPVDEISKIAAEVPEPEGMGDEDEFEEDSNVPVISHVKNGRKTRLADIRVDDDTRAMDVLRELFRQSR